jgi:hypothetical protein
MQSIVNSAKSKLGKLSGKKEYPGTIVNTVFRTKASVDTVSPSALVTLSSGIGIVYNEEDGRILKEKEKVALTRTVNHAIDETLDELEQRGMYDLTWTCQESLGDLNRDFGALLQTKLDRSKVKTTTNYIANPSHAGSCPCPRHYYNGQSVRAMNLGVAIQTYGKKGTDFDLQYCHTNNDDTSKPTIQCFDPTEVDALTRYQRMLENRIRDVLEQSETFSPNQSLNRTEFDQATLYAIETMLINEPDFCDLPHQCSATGIVDPMIFVNFRKGSDTFRPISIDNSSATSGAVGSVEEWIWKMGVPEDPQSEKVNISELYGRCDPDAGE